MDLPFLGTTDMRAEYTNSQKPASLESDVVAAEYASIAEALKLRIAAEKAV
jgi:hypothetical protein